MNSEGYELVSFITPPDLRQAAEEAQEDILPASKRLYEKAYDKFNDWRNEHKTKSASESILLAYFKKLAENYAPTSMWSIYSMLKTMINLKEKVDIGRYATLTALLKRKSEGHVCKKANVLTPDQINQFLSNAPDKEYLHKKVALIIGISGACRKSEITDLKFSDIKSEGDLLVVRIYNKKCKREKFFTIGGEFSRIVKKYIALRPKKTTKDRFFMAYRNGACINQVIGINTFAKIPQQIATYLGLKNPSSYTGHTFRRSSATLVADAGANITTLKRLGDWKSAAIAEGYVEESVKNKARIGNIIESAVNLPSTSQKKNYEMHASQVAIRQKMDPVVVPSTSRTEDDDIHTSKVIQQQKVNTVINVGPTSSSAAVSSSMNAPIFKFENCTVTINNTYVKEN
ncbi:uncharacterized protein LOC130671118 [Microplitis mediator]|uniref:uncharacterized protein LOC130664282 n=1 Tax=Microplitis mediator TaxID=375433 RepID=UPI002554BD08|nr:uncharacterized protein LOC130664282 [Microplitis mediator]XP_057330810.1 uncharacterized protein LOC130671118 [Microplitis mediator]